MNIRQYILLLSIGTAMAWSAWFVVLISIDPATAGWQAFLIFYVTLFTSLAGLFMTISTVVRVQRFPVRDLGDLVHISLRQGLALSLLVTVALILMSQNLLTWWTLLLLVLSIIFIEFVLHSRKTIINDHG
ncbi:MAG: hypothetical protein Q8P30_01995 [Candidatus Uhrbacteria bacterium]|nr:hypothetical protein [Candidatus Uhrbacteria bacterium]